MWGLEPGSGLDRAQEPRDTPEGLAGWTTAR